MRLDGNGNIPSVDIIHMIILNDVPFLYDGVSLDGRVHSNDVLRLVDRSMKCVALILWRILLLLVVTLC